MQPLRVGQPDSDAKIPCATPQELTNQKKIIEHLRTT